MALKEGFSTAITLPGILFVLTSGTCLTGRQESSVILSDMMMLFLCL